MDKNIKAAPAAADGPPTAADEAVAALLGILRGVDREVQTSLELSAEAEAAVARFRAIAADLSTTSGLFGN